MDNNKVNISNDTLFEGEIFAAYITIEGKVIGNLQATTSILIKENGWVEGNIQAPNIYLAKGCYHKGDIYLDDSSSAKIDMNQLEFKSDINDEPETRENPTPEAQSVSNRTKSEPW